MKERNLDTGSPSKGEVGVFEQAIPGLTEKLQDTNLKSDIKDINILNSQLAKTVAAAQERLTGPISAIAKGTIFGAAGMTTPEVQTRIYGTPDRYATRTEIVDKKGKYADLQAAAASISFIPGILEDLSKLAVPLRQEIAPRISAAFLVADPTWRENNKEVVSTYAGDVLGPIGLFGSTATPAFEKALADSRKAVDPNTPSTDPFAARVYSPGRSLNLLISDIVPGEQGAEKLNWENGNEVDEYYRQGLPQFFSGFADFGFTWLDPVYLGPAAGVKAYTKVVKRPITSNNVSIVVSEAQAAKDPAVRNSFSPILDLVEKVSSPETFNPSALDNIGMINGGSGANITKVLVEAQIIGGRDLAADVLSISMDTGAVGILDEITVKSKTVGAQLQTLLEQELLIKKYVADVLDPNVIVPPIGSIKSIRKYVAEAPLGAEDIVIREKQFASYLENDVLKKLREEISQKSDLSKVYMEMRGIAGTALNQTVPITALRKLSERQVLTAQSADDAYWGIESTFSTDGASRIAYWVNPSGRLHEVPRGMAQLAGPAGLRSDREIAARIRDLAKVVDISAVEARAIYNGYKMLGTKSEMFGYAEQLLTRAEMQISAKHIPLVNALTPEQQSTFRKVYEVLNLQTRKSRGQVIQEASANNYTIVVNGKKTKIPQLESLINDVANDYALEISKGTRNIATPEEIKFVRDELIKGTPTTTSQVPGIHFAPRAKDIEDFVILHKEELTRVIDDIIDGTINSKTIDEVLSKPEDYINKGLISGVGRATGEELKTLTKDTLANLALGWQNNFWKPLTLIGFSYTARNVLEGMSRVAVMFAEFHQQRGFKYSDMFADYTNISIPTVVSAVANRGKSKAYREEVKDWKRSLKDFDKKFDGLTAKMSLEQKAAEDAFLNSQDSIAMSMKSFDETRATLGQFVTDSPEGIQFLTTVKRSTDLAFKQGVPKGASKEFIEAITIGDYKRSWELSMSMSPEQLSLNLKYIKDQSLETLREIQFFVDRGNLGPGAFQVARALQIDLSHISAATDTAYLGLLNRSKSRGQLEGFIARVGTNKPVKVRSNEGLYEPIRGSGYLVDDSYANNIGQIMKGQVSSASSTTSTILNVRQQIAQTKWNMHAREELIFPYEVIGNSVTDKPNRSWAQAFSDYSNNIYHNDALSIKVLQANTPTKRENLKSTLEKWLTSEKSLEWRNQLEYEASKYPSRSDGKSKFVTLIEERIAEIDSMFPLVGANGENLSKLRQKVVDRKFTRADALAIPEVDRMPINGVTLAKNPRDIWNGFRLYRSVVNSIFKYLGTIPEDNFVRFPFYRVVYRNEVRRRYDMVIKAGKNPENYEQQILNAARQTAYKEVMERLYSIERYTDLGQAMQYLSPFYMSGQNSARFWAGAVSRNPAVIVPALKVWNIPNTMGFVYDEDGNRVAYDTPWSAENNDIQIGLPLSVAKYYGSENFTAPKQTLDLAFGGRVPGIPSLGGAFVDSGTVNFMRYLTGTALDPDLFAIKAGLGPNFIGEKVIPFYQTVKENPNENFAMRTARALVGYGSQWKALMAVGSAVTGKANVSFMTRHDSLYRSAIINAEKEGKTLTAKEHADALSLAYSQTVKSFLTEWLIGMSPTPSKFKLENTQQIERDKASNFIEKYGYEQGIIEYAKTLGTAGESSSIPILAVANVSTDNIFGLFSNTQSIRNFNLNKDLVTKIDKINSNSSVIGYLMNEGNPSQDYSVTADEYLYTTTINNKNLKQKIAEVDAWELQRRAYNNDYYPFANAVDLMRKADSQANKEQSADFYKQLKDEKRAELEAKYPIYALEKKYKQQDAVVNDIRTMYAMLDDKKFMSTVGDRSKVVSAAKDYLFFVRPTLVDLKANEVATTEIDAIKLQYMEDAANGDAEVSKFLQIFFSRDDYTPIDPTDAWK